MRLILSAEKTKWNFDDSKKMRIDCREIKKEIPFNNRRRVELKILDEYQTNSEYVESKLVDSLGKKVKVIVEDIYLILIEKIHKFYLLKDGVDITKDRESSLSDVVDLVRLIDSKKVNKFILIKQLNNSEEYMYILKLITELRPQISQYLKG